MTVCCEDCSCQHSPFCQIITFWKKVKWIFIIDNNETHHAPFMLFLKLFWGHYERPPAVISCPLLPPASIVKDKKYILKVCGYMRRCFQKVKYREWKRSHQLLFTILHLHTEREGCKRIGHKWGSGTLSFQVPSFFKEAVSLSGINKQTKKS